MIPVVSVPGGVTIKFIRIMAQVCGGPGPDINVNISSQISQEATCII